MYTYVYCFFTPKTVVVVVVVVLVVVGGGLEKAMPFRNLFFRNTPRATDVGSALRLPILSPFSVTQAEFRALQPHRHFVMTSAGR